MTSVVCTRRWCGDSYVIVLAKESNQWNVLTPMPAEGVEKIRTVIDSVARLPDDACR